MSTLTPMLADLIDAMQTHEMVLATKAALRALNKAFYLIDLEAAFLHLVYAVDALCHSKRLTGGRQRVWVAAFTSRGNAETFATQLDGYDTHYGYRNKLVHEGRSFAAIGVKGEDACQFMHNVLASCIKTFLLEGFMTRQDAANYAYALLQLPAYQPSMAALVTKNFKLPIVGDAKFIEHMTP